MWFVYILKCADGTFYTGMATNATRRVKEHNHSDLGTKYTRGRRPVKLVYSRKMRNKSLAAKEEWRIKRMARIEKIKLIKMKYKIKSPDLPCYPPD